MIGLFFAGLAALSTAVFYGSVMRGRDPNATAALLVAAFAAAAAARRAGPRACAAAALAAPAATLALSMFGATLVAIAGLACAALGFLRSSPEDGAHGDPLTAALAAAAALAWTRLSSLLFGNPVLGWAATVAGAAAGAAAGSWLRKRLPEAGETLRPDFATLCAGAALLFGLHFVRFLGYNAGEASFLRAPIRCASDALFLGQAALVPAAAALLLSLSPAPGRRFGFFAAAAGAAAAAAAGVKFGPSAVAVVAGLGLAALGAARARRAAGPWTAGVAAAALLAAATAGNPLADIWTNRLNAAYPGGRFLTFSDAGSEACGVYQFSSGLTILLRDGVTDANGAFTAKREAHFPLLLRPNAKAVLLAGTRNPLTLSAAASHGGRVDLLDGGPVFAPEGWKEPKNLRRVLRPEAPYDAIIVELADPLHSVASARLATREALQGWRRLLAPGGVLALRVPFPYFHRSLARTIATVRAAFPHAGVFRFPESVVLAASAEALPENARPASWDYGSPVQADDPDLVTYLNGQTPWHYPITDADVEPGTPETLDKSANALPIGDILAAAAPPPDGPPPSR